MWGTLNACCARILAIMMKSSIFERISDRSPGARENWEQLLSREKWNRDQLLSREKWSRENSEQGKVRSSGELAIAHLENWENWE